MLHHVMSERPRGMVGAAELGVMLVNTPRGQPADEDALLETVRAGGTRGLTLDVFGQPLPRGSPWRGGTVGLALGHEQGAGGAAHGLCGGGHHRGVV